jgi:dTDP-glucose 4,6-dehydratase
MAGECRERSADAGDEVVESRRESQTAPFERFGPGQRAVAHFGRAVSRRLVGARMRFSTQFILDAAVWLVTLYISQVLRFDLVVSMVNLPATAVLALTTIALQGGIGLAMRLYRGKYIYGSFEEVRSLTIATTLVAVPVFAGTLLFGPTFGVPRGTVPLALPMALVSMFAVRYLARLTREVSATSSSAEPVIVFGAGYLGESLIRRMQTDPHSSYDPVAIVDDNKRKLHARIRDVRVMGTLEDLPQLSELTGAKVLVVAIAKADAALLTRVAEVAGPLGIHAKVLPPIDDLLRGVSEVSDLRDLSIEDLLGRRPVDTDVESIAGYLTGKRVMVTGAGGSIGSELCRQISRFNPAELIMLDRDESGLQAAELNVLGHGLLDGRDVVLADIRDTAALKTIFEERRPEVVFHAAALKHLPMLQQYPSEAWKTNVLGTQNVLEAARSVDVAAFINISTDKAADPSSVLGHSKRLAERLTARMGDEIGRPYLSVRFGNVLGSRGSMLPLFTSMIENGGPLTITHPEVTRYFMTIPEACQLVVQAGAIGKPGEVLILDMGKPVRILEIANRMIEMSGRPIEIVYTGLRPGEKLHEVLWTADEDDQRRIHPKISHAVVPPLDPAELDWSYWQQVWADTDLPAAETPDSAGKLS